MSVAAGPGTTSGEPRGGRGESPLVIVSAVGAAEGARAAARALCCAGADSDRASLLVDVDGRPPRPTLFTTAAARGLEERLVVHLRGARVAARGQVCHLAVEPDPEGFASAAAAVAVGRGGLAVIHVAPSSLQGLLDQPGAPRPTAALLRADLAQARPLVALLVRDLGERGIAAVVLKRPLGWLAARRAHFGALPLGSPGAIPARELRLLGLSGEDRR